MASKSFTDSMKKILRVMLATLIVLSSVAVSAETVTLYAADGGTIQVSSYSVEYYINNGWSKEPPFVRLYTLDGRSQLFEKSRVAAQLEVGWYNGEPVKMYALDGRTKYVGANDIEAYKKVGWYNGKPVKMYAEDGRTITIGANEVTEYEKVGWYTEPVQKLYTVDGRSKYFKKSQIAAQLKVGWYTEPMQILYTADGKSKVFKKSQVMAQLKVGWYISVEDAKLEPVRKALNNCRNSVLDIYVLGRALHDAYTFYWDAYYRDNISVTVLKILDELGTLRDSCKGVDELELLYSAADYDIPVIITDVDEVENYANYVMAIRSVYNVLCDRYGVNRLEW